MAKVIGLDIGGTKITGALFNGNRQEKELVIVTPRNLYEFERNILKLLDFLSAGQKISAVGAGMAGLVDPQKGSVIYSPNIKFAKNLQLVRFLKLNGYKKVKIDNDANCFTRAELLAGQGKNLKNFLAVTLGTGIGGGIVIGGKIYRGKNNAGAEFGHILASDGYFEPSYQKLRDQQAFKSLGISLGKLLGSLANIFAPEAIIIGGGFGTGEAGNYLPKAKTEMAKALFNKKSQTKILVSKLKNAGALGAALLVK